MQYVLIALLLLGLAITAAYGMAARPKQTPQKRDSVAILYKAITYSKPDIVKKLRLLSKYQRPQEKPVISATCYISVSMGEPENSRSRKPVIRKVSYVCPTCGQKTVYRESDLPYNFDILRSQVSAIPNIHVTLIEKEFCRHCSPQVKYPYLSLKIKYPGTSDSNVIRGATGEDVRLIANFMKCEYGTLAGSDEQRQYSIERLEKLLGVRIDR